MFGIDLDKLLLVGVLVGLIVGPARLREWRRKLPQIVGRVHALYQQGRADVTRNLDDLAPDWRDYDPRQFHPRRILRDLGEDAQRSAQGAPSGAGLAPRTGESPVESSPADEGGPRDREERGVSDDAADVPRVPRLETGQPASGGSRSPSHGQAARSAPPTSDAGDDLIDRRPGHPGQREIHFPPVGGGVAPTGGSVESPGVRAETIGQETDAAAPVGRGGCGSAGSCAPERPGDH